MWPRTYWHRMFSPPPPPTHTRQNRLERPTTKEEVPPLPRIPPPPQTKVTIVGKNEILPLGTSCRATFGAQTFGFQNPNPLPPPSSSLVVWGGGARTRPKHAIPIGRTKQHQWSEFRCGAEGPRRI